jgi:hypothetical protein
MRMTGREDQLGIAAKFSEVLQRLENVCTVFPDDILRESKYGTQSLTYFVIVGEVMIEPSLESRHFAVIILDNLRRKIV